MESEQSRSWPGFLSQLFLTTGWELGIAAVFLITWIWPHAIQPDMVTRLAFLMLIEFIVLHATAFLAFAGASDPSIRFRAIVVGGLLAVYGVFGIGFSFAYGDPWPLMALLITLAPRISMAVFQQTDLQGFARGMAQWTVMTAMYLIGAVATLLAPIPRLGITREVVEAQEMSGEGIWFDEPYRVMAFGVCYFAATAILSFINLMRPPAEGPLEAEGAKP